MKIPRLKRKSKSKVVDHRGEDGQSSAGRRRRDRLSGLALPIALIMIVIAIPISTGALITSSHVDSNTNDLKVTQNNLVRTQNNLLHSELGTCARLQKQRERANVSDARQFLILDAISKNPGINSESRKLFNSYASSTQYFPPTLCPEVITDPDSVSNPTGIKYEILGVDFAKKVQDASADSTITERIQQPVPACWTKFHNCTLATIAEG